MATGPKFTGRAVILLTVIVLLVGSYTSALHAWWGQRSEIQATKSEIASRRDSIRELENTKRRFDDPAYVQQQARERFGWVMPGEVGYRVIGTDGELQGEMPVLADLPEPKQRHWTDTLWASVEGAGREPAARLPDPDKVIKE